MHAILITYARKAPRAQVFGLYPSRICDFWSSEFRAPFHGILKKNLEQGRLRAVFGRTNSYLLTNTFQAPNGRLLWCL